MAPYRLYFVGTQLLFLSHVANSFILLTANMEDVKKIARKFVSDSLAEKIAEFVAKATEQMGTNVSEENDKIFEGVQDVSDENQLQNIARERIEKPTKTTQNSNKERTKYAEFVKKYENEETTRVKDISNKGQVINWEKEVNEIVYDSKSKEVQHKANEVEPPEVDYNQKLDATKLDNEETIQDYVQQKVDNRTPTPDYEDLLDKTKQKLSKKPKPDNKHSKLDYEWPKVQFEQQNPDQKEAETEHQKPKHEHQKPDYEPHYEQPKSIYEKPNTVKKPKSHNVNQKSHLKELRRPDNVDEHQHRFEPTVKPTIGYTVLNHRLLRNGPPNAKRPAHHGNRLTGFDSLESSSQPALQGFNIASLTTKKERTEVDQYDNPNYPKSEFIATSGPVALPKVPLMKPWWEKEMVTRNVN